MAQNVCRWLEVAKCGLHVGGYLLLVALLVWLICHRGRKIRRRHHSSPKGAGPAAPKAAPRPTKARASLLRRLLGDPHLWAYLFLLVAALLELVILVATHNGHPARPAGAGGEAAGQVIEKH